MKKDIFAKIHETSKKYASQMGYAKKEPRKELTMREMQKRMRESINKPQQSPQQINEQRHTYVSEEVYTDEDVQVTKLSGQEEKQQEDGLRNFFDDDNVTINFNPVEIYKQGEITSGIFWAGSIDGQLKFVYMVTPDEASSGVKIERAPTFDPNNADNQNIEKKIVDYYDSFYEYWSKNQLER